MRSKLRSAFTRYPPKFDALASARRKYVGKNKAQKWEYQCELCTGWFKQTDVNVDHIIPCGPLKSWEDLPGFCERLFCSVDGLRVLCLTCHKRITKEQREETARENASK